MDYVVKTKQKHPGIPISEWFCQSLADACGIPTPQFAQIKLMDGRVGFGSQWDESAVKDQGLIAQITSAVPGEVWLAQKFSEIYVIDLFTYNRDRHLGNYFFVKTNKGHGVKAYDFSRAFLYNAWPMPPLPLGSCNTTACYSALRVGYPFNVEAGEKLVGKIAGIPSSEVDTWLGEVPSDWITDDQKNTVSVWWKNESPKVLDKILKGISDGTIF
jgi:hypothetical protein